MRLQLILLLLVVPAYASYRSFLADCIKKRGNGVCDMECRNFTGKLNDFEIEDCASAETKAYDVSITVEMYPLEALRQLQKYELLERQILKTQVEVSPSMEEKLEEIADEYRKKVNDFSEKLIWPIQLNFTVFLRVCDECPHGEDFIEECSKKLPDVLAIRVTHQPVNPIISSILPIAAGFMLLLAVVGAVGGKGFVTTRKRRIATQTAVYLPPMEDAKRRKTSSAVTEPLDIVWGYPVPAHIVFTPPPPPTRVPPPISQGHFIQVTNTNEFDLAANYEEVVVLKSTPLHRYVEEVKNDSYRANELQKLVSQYEINGQNDHGCTAFLLAVRGGNVQLAKDLLYFGADGNRMDVSHMTALHHAVENQDVKMLKMLTRWEVCLNTQSRVPELQKVLVDAVIDGRRAIDALTKTGLTPLMKCAFAAYDMAVPLAKILIECGANVADTGDLECSNPKLRTVLHYAAQNCQPALIKYLLSTHAGMNIINYMDFKDTTALCFSCEAGNLECVQILLANGALQFLPDNDKEKQPRAVASCEEIVNMLDDFKGKHVKGGTVRSNKRNQVKAKRPQRRSSGYYSGDGDHSPPPAPRSSPPRTPPPQGYQFPTISQGYQDPTQSFNKQDTQNLQYDQQNWNYQSSMNIQQQYDQSAGEIQNQQFNAYQQSATYENYLYP